MPHLLENQVIEASELLQLVSDCQRLLALDPHWEDKRHLNDILAKLAKGNSGPVELRTVDLGFIEHLKTEYGQAL